MWGGAFRVFVFVGREDILVNLEVCWSWEIVAVSRQVAEVSSWRIGGAQPER
jgi:hypothetical protein